MTHAHRYVAERKLPDKAIDLIDEAAARVRMVQESKPEGVSDLEREVRVTVRKVRVRVRARVRVRSRSRRASPTSSARC